MWTERAPHDASLATVGRTGTIACRVLQETAFVLVGSDDLTWLKPGEIVELDAVSFRLYVAQGRVERA